MTVAKLIYTPNKTSTPSRTLGLSWFLPLLSNQPTRLFSIPVDEQLSFKQVTSTITAALYKEVLQGSKVLKDTDKEVKEYRYTFCNLLKLMDASSACSSSLHLNQQQMLEKNQKRLCKVILEPACDSYDNGHPGYVATL